MDIDENKIASFLRNELSENEKLAFLERLKEEDALREKFLLEKQLFESLNPEDWSYATTIKSSSINEYKEIFESDEVISLKNTISEAAKGYKSAAAGKRRNLPLYLAVAAMIAIVVTISSLYFSSPSLETLYAQNIDLNELPDLVSRSESQSPDLVRAQQLFENKEYAEVETILTQIIEDNSTLMATKLLYLGVSQMELGNYEAAEKTYDKLIDSELLDASKGYWYKALLYLKMNNTEEATNVLTKIEKEKLYNHEKATKILNALR